MVTGRFSFSGITLRKVEQKQREDERTEALPCDVASILQRRVAIEVSDSDSGSQNGSDYDSDDWEDDQ